MSLEVFINKFSTTLSSSLTSSATSMTLVSVGSLPSFGNCRVRIEDEVLIVTLNGSTTVTVQRGAEFTTAVSHASSISVYFLLTAGAMNQARKEYFNYDTYANRGINGNVGRWYRDSDGNTMAHDNGSTWDNFGWCPPAITPPDMSTFTALGFAATTATNKNFVITPNGVGQYLAYTGNNGGSEQVGAYVVALPSSTTDWTAIVGIQHNVPNTHSAHAGLCIYEASSNKLNTWGFRTTTSGAQATSYNFTVSNASAVTATTSYQSPNFYPACSYQSFFKFYMIKYIHAESTTQIRLFESVDGINWAYVLQQAFGNGMTFPSHVGFYCDYYANTIFVSKYPGINIYHWSFTEP